MNYLVVPYMCSLDMECDDETKSGRQEEFRNHMVLFMVLAERTWSLYSLPLPPSPVVWHTSRY